MRSEILEKHPDAGIAIYAVWFRTLWTDFRFLWAASALEDRRVLEFWDSEKIAGRWYSANVTRREPAIEWDAWILYASGQAFSDVSVEWGRTIVDTRDRLRAELEKALQRRYAER